MVSEVKKYIQVLSAIQHIITYPLFEHSDFDEHREETMAHAMRYPDHFID